MVTLDLIPRMFADARPQLVCDVERRPYGDTANLRLHDPADQNTPPLQLRNVPLRDLRSDAQLAIFVSDTREDFEWWREYKAAK